MIRWSMVLFSVVLTAISGVLAADPNSRSMEPASSLRASAEEVRPVPAGSGSYPAELVRVIDGDTFEARVHVWPGIEITTKVRLRGIDAPELNARCPAELTRAAAARDALANLLSKGAIAIRDVSLDKYGGRVLASASTRESPDLSANMLATGLARPYAGGRREPWCELRASR